MDDGALILESDSPHQMGCCVVDFFSNVEYWYAGL